MPLYINSEKLSKLIESLYTLVHVRIAIYDEAFNEVFTVPKNYSCFCDMMNKIPFIHRICCQCAIRMCEECHRRDSLLVDRCHAGLTEVVTPIHENNLTIGYIMFGQFTNNPDKNDFFTKAEKLCCGYGLPNDEFKRRISTVPYKTVVEIESISEIVNAFTSYIYLEHIISYKKEGSAYRIIEYIDSNLDKDLSAAALCELFSVSKTALYETLGSFMPNGIAYYIKHKRIERAAFLLRNTDKPVERIATMVGFLDDDYFRRVFKSIMGRSAATYRTENNLN